MSGVTVTEFTITMFLCIINVLIKFIVKMFSGLHYLIIVAISKHLIVDKKLPLGEPQKKA